MDEFSANDGFHRTIEEFSRRIYAPIPEGSAGLSRTKWFYERARGQLKSGKRNELA